ncbi:hexuronate transporter [Escherichia coli]|nr:hexuronate transporter [Escherichia coli]
MRKIKGLRWYMIALVTLGTVLGYLTRNTVAAAAPTLMEELNISTNSIPISSQPILLLIRSCNR